MSYEQNPANGLSFRLKESPLGNISKYEDLTVVQERINEAATNSDAIRPISELRARLQQDGLLDDLDL